MKMLSWTGIGLSALQTCLAPAPAAAQHATTSAAPGGFAPEQVCLTWSGGTIGSGTLVPCATGSGGSAGASGSSPGTPSYVTGKADQRTFTLANGVTLPAAGSSSPVTVDLSGNYGWSYIISGTSPSVKLQVLGPDGTTWLDVATVTASGSQPITVIAGTAGAQVRLTDAGANSATLTSSFSK